MKTRYIKHKICHTCEGKGEYLHCERPFGPSDSHKYELIQCVTCGGSGKVLRLKLPYVEGRVTDIADMQLLESAINHLRHDFNRKMGVKNAPTKPIS